MSFREELMEWLQSVKASLTVALTTIGTGAGTALEVLPTILGMIATTFGIILSAVLIRTHYKRGTLHDIEAEIAKKKLAEYEEKEKDRLENALSSPRRRECDP